MKVVIYMWKFSHWLEAYSIFCYFKGIDAVKVVFMESDRVNKKSVTALFEEFKKNISFEYEIAKDKEELGKKIREEFDTLVRGDVFAAPIFPFRNMGAYMPIARKRGIVTVHLNDGFPDCFGYYGYRLGYLTRGGVNVIKLLKQSFLLPFFYFFWRTHMPDLSFYNMAPNVKIPVVKRTVQAFVPKLEEEKKRYLQGLTKGEKRPLLIAGFDYELDKMVKYLKIDKYIATSKMREIIIDGKRIALDYYVCAEDVLLSGCSDRIIGYSSTAMTWAYRIGGIDIVCYESPKMNEIYGYYGKFARSTMKKCGLTLLPACKDMIKN